MADNTEEKPWYYEPVKYSLGDTLTDQEKYDYSAPYLGLADVMKPEDNTQEFKQTRGALKAQALGNVLSSLFDTAVSSTGGLVEKNGEDQAQLKNLAEYNRLRAESEAEGRQYKSAQLQAKMEAIRQQIVGRNKQQDDDRTLAIHKADQQAALNDSARRDAAATNRSEMIYGKKADQSAATQKAISERAAAIQRTINERVAKTTAARNVGRKDTELFYDSNGTQYILNKGQVNALYRLISANLGSLQDQKSAKMLGISDVYDPKMAYSTKSSAAQKYFEDPAIFNGFLNIADNGTEDNGTINTPVAQKATTPILKQDAELSEGLNAFKTGKKAGLLEWLKAKYPNDNAKIKEVGNRIIQEAQAGN